MATSTSAQSNSPSNATPPSAPRRRNRRRGGPPAAPASASPPATPAAVAPSPAPEPANDPSDQPDPAAGQYLWLFVRFTPNHLFAPFAGPGAHPLDMANDAPPDHPLTGAPHPHWRAAMESLEQIAVRQGYPDTPETLRWVQTPSNAYGLGDLLLFVNQQT